MLLGIDVWQKRQCKCFKSATLRSSKQTLGSCKYFFEFTLRVVKLVSGELFYALVPPSPVFFFFFYCDQVSLAKAFNVLLLGASHASHLQKSFQLLSDFMCDMSSDAYSTRCDASTNHYAESHVHA